MIKKIIPWIISAVVCLLSVEIFGAAVFLHSGGKLVYFNQQKVTEPAAEPVKYKQRLHPYFGFTGPYSANDSIVTNSLGFWQRQDRVVPFTPKPNDFVVFVFGASVAGNVVTPPQGGPPIQYLLQNVPQLKDKNVVVFNMAQGPQKQPQQLMELAFVLALGQHIDLVLNIGGTVEFTSGLSNFEGGIDPIFPPIATLGAIGRELAPVDASSSDYYELAYRLSRDRAAVKTYSRLVTESSSGIGFLENRFLLAFYSRSLIDDLANYEKTITRKGRWDKLFSLDMAMSVTKDNVIDTIFKTWLRCSDTMRLMASANGAAYLEIVHPNPYHSKKKLTPNEIAELAPSPMMDYFQRASAQGYDLIEQRSDMLRSRGIVSALTLFDENLETIYIDGTGHFSNAGETILGQFIADQVNAKMSSGRGRVQVN